NIRSTILVLLYHKLTSMLSGSLLPLSLDRLAQSGNDLRGERNPAWPQRCRTNALQPPSFAPLCNGGHIHIEQFGCGFCRVASISPLSSWGRFRTFWTSSRDVIRIANPLDFADGKRAAHPSSLPFLVEHSCDLRIRMRRRQRPHALHDLGTGLTFFPGLLVTWDSQVREGFGLPANSHIDDVATLGERHILDQPPQQLLALGKGRRGSMPNGWQIVGQAADLLALRGREREGRLFGTQGIFPLQLFDLRQFLIPFPLQAPGNQTVVWVDSLVAPPCQICLILGPLDLTVPLLIDLPGASFQRIERRESHFQLSRLNGFQ